MSDEVTKSLQRRLQAIPDGQVAGIARRAGITADRLRKLRRGLSLDVRLETLAKLAAAIGEPIGYFLGEEVKSSDRPTLLPGCVAVSERQLLRVIKLLRRVSRLTSRLADSLPTDDTTRRPTRRKP